MLRPGNQITSARVIYRRSLLRILPTTLAKPQPSGGPEAGRLTTPAVGEWRGVRAAAQRDVGTDRGGSLAGQGEGERGRRREDNRHAICFGGQDRS